MEEVNGILLNSFPLKELIKVSDLIYFDGPLLSHFQTKNKDNYLFYWVDVNETHNRWLILRTSLDKLQAFVGKKISLLELVQHPDDNFLYKVDISANLNYENVALIYPEDIPASYLPSQDSFYNQEANQDLDLSIYSEKYQSGILQAYYQNSAKVGYNEINLEVFGPSLYYLNDLTQGLGKAFLKDKIKTALKDKNGKPLIDRDAITNATKLKYFANAGGSFSALFKPISGQVGIPGIKTEPDEFIEYVMNFMNVSEDYERLSTYVETLDKSIITSYKFLLHNIIDAKLNFYLKWENTISEINQKKVIDYKEASKILSNLEKLEYDDTTKIQLIGRFTMVNLRSNSYEFHDLGDDNLSKGKFDKDRFEVAYRIKFSSIYEVVIERHESKQAGRKEPKISDVLISFIETEVGS